MRITTRPLKPLLALVFLALFISEAATADTNQLSQFTEKLTPEQLSQFIEITEEQFCPCGSPQSFKETLLKPGECRTAEQLARFLATKVQENKSKRRTVKALLARIAMLSARVELNTSGAIPRMGDAKAPIQIVVFSDFQCPFCSRIGEPLKKVVNNNEDVAMVYKYYPLPMHKQAGNAAKAACAANLQGKFWQMHDGLFAEQKQLDSGDFDAIARKAGLNMKKYKKDLMSVQCVEAVESDINEGDKVQLQGTPSIYVNGLLVDTPDDLQQAIDEARQFELTP